jgi:hypothetical protein
VPYSNIDKLFGKPRPLQSQGLASSPSIEDSCVASPQVKGMDLSQRTKSLLRVLLRRFPGLVQFARIGLWYLSSYFPRLVASRVVRRVPEVRYFGAALSSSHLAMLLQNVNAAAPTRVCRVMTKHGSDKGRAHNYTTVYSALFQARWHQPLRLLELGMGSNNPDVPSNMGIFGVPGASHRGWRELFPNASVYGADVDRRILFQEDRIKTFYCDQSDHSSIRELWSHPELRDGVDIIIEDGLHTFDANVSFLEGSLDRLRPGGIYITEDILGDCVEDWYDRLETVYSKRYPTYEFALVSVPDPGNQANNLLVVRRGAE